MSDKMNQEHKATGDEESIPHHLQVEEYGDGHVKARHGIVNGWLIVVYVALFVWGIYYAFTYWGGLGPGLEF